MHYELLILFERPVADLCGAVAVKMEPFRVDWDADPPKDWTWDYYTLGEDGPFSDPLAAELAGGLDIDTVRRVCRVDHLPDGYAAHALLTPDGRWQDLQDFGWRQIDGDSSGNRVACAAWVAHFREVLAKYPAMVGVAVHCHR